eukprot:COSAG06_NODE_526_length_14658_cov_21.228038_3_plen_768_part_00
MPIQIVDQDFERYAFNDVYNQYTANAGDDVECQWNIRTQMRVSSISNPLTRDIALNQITSPSVSWIDEGFRTGNKVRIQKWSATQLVYTYYAFIEYVDDQLLDLTGSASQTWYDAGAGEQIVIVVVNGDNSIKEYTNLEFMMNNSLSGQQGNSLSLIDGEQSRVIFENLDQAVIGQPIFGTFIPNQSGGFLRYCTITRGFDTSDDFIFYTMRAIHCPVSAYDQSWFLASSSLKVYAQWNFTPQPNDPFPPAQVVYDEVANTGWFNQPFGNSTTQSSLLQGIDELDYCVPSVHTIILQTPVTNASKIAFGACYISIDDTYYKNRPESQANICMLVRQSDLANQVSIVSAPNPDGATYQIVINNVTIQNGEVSVTFTFAPSPEFNTFMENRQDGDRLMYIYFCVDNVNFLVFGDQMKCDPPIGGELGLTTNFGFLDHGQNITQIGGSKQGFVANTEDDCAWYGTFLLDNDQIYDNLTCEIEVYNGTSEDDFSLQSSQFSFGGIQINNSGQYLIDESLPIVSTLPSNSAKINALFKRVPSMDTATQYGVSVYYPFLLNWQYWLEQQNASTDFYPTQNRNWEQYDDIPAWEIRFKISLIKDGLAYINSNVIRDLPYDSSTVIDQNIDLFIEATGQVVQVVAIGEMMRVVATHTINDGRAWDPNDTWGMITVEPTQSTPRQICSTVLPFDNDLSNPLRPIDNVQMVITYPSQNIAKMECFFDPDIINLSNGVKFTTKIKGCPTTLDTNGKRTTDGTLKTTTGLNSEIKTLAN